MEEYPTRAFAPRGRGLIAGKNDVNERGLVCPLQEGMNHSVAIKTLCKKCLPFVRRDESDDGRNGFGDGSSALRKKG